VPTPDDERFEHYLRQFRPLDPEPLPNEQPARVTHRRFLLAAWALAAAAVLFVAALTMQLRRDPAEPAHPHDTGIAVSAERLMNPMPLSVGTANAFLAQSPSVKSTLDQMAFQSQTAQIPKGKRSALAALGKENFKL